MGHLNQDGAPFYFATDQPSTAAAMDEDIYITVTAGVPTHPDRVESIDIILSIDFAKHLLDQLGEAVVVPSKNETQRDAPLLD
jgi:hypothetical protein